MDQLVYQLAQTLNVGVEFIENNFNNYLLEYSNYVLVTKLTGNIFLGIILALGCSVLADYLIFMTYDKNAIYREDKEEFGMYTSNGNRISLLKLMIFIPIIIFIIIMFIVILAELIPYMSSREVYAIRDLLYLMNK